MSGLYNDLLIKNEALCLRGRCAVVFCNIVDTHFHGNLNEFKGFFFDYTLKNIL